MTCQGGIIESAVLPVLKTGIALRDVAAGGAFGSPW